MTAYTRLAHNQEGKNPSTDRGGAHEVSPLTDDLAIDSYWGISVFFRLVIHEKLHILQ